MCALEYISILRSSFQSKVREFQQKDKILCDSVLIGGSLYLEKFSYLKDADIRFTDIKGVVGSSPVVSM